MARVNLGSLQSYADCKQFGGNDLRQAYDCQRQEKMQETPLKATKVDSKVVRPLPTALQFNSFDAVMYQHAELAYGLLITACAPDISKQTCI